MFGWVLRALVNGNTALNRGRTTHPGPPPKGRELEGEIWCFRGHLPPKTPNFASFLSLPAGKGAVGWANYRTTV